MILNQSKINLCLIPEDSDNNDVGSLAGIDYGCLHCGLNADTFENQVGFIITESIGNSLTKIFF